MKKLIFLLIVCLLFFLPLLFYKEQLSPKQIEKQCEIMITIEGTAEPIPLEQYIIGVVAAEMPASFHPEALKAQAIAARTYVIRTTNFGSKPIKPTTAHQVFASKEARQEKWLTTFSQYEQKISSAVEATASQILTYNDEPISAMFHASSNGLTESSYNYSGNEIPYLQTTTTPEQDIQTMTLSVASLNAALGTKWTQVDYLALKLERNDTGRVQKISGKRTFSGRDFRQLLGLRSTDFTLVKNGSAIDITTRGYGHGVGMSQYGANEFAKLGRSMEQILLHYYPNTTLASAACIK
ncbi:stage II sporulation protein D [Solibacillus sp. CAU 1738]|uniref:stage II sporulation protein D n=1 Tax=Solibacillus sp. CAU 1738 TaxID=3140363 RepID=UPI003260E28D